MKNGWETIPMGKLCSITSGESDTQDAVEDGAYAFFDRSRTVKKSSRFLYNCEALIIPGEGKEFLPRHFTGKFDLHQRAYALLDFTNRIDPRFLYFYLHHFSHYLPSVAVGATVKSLRRRHFEQLPVAVTTLPEQQRIVGVLDEAFAGLATAQANAEKNLQNARALFESHLQSIFTQRGKGWVEKKLSEVCAITSVLIDPRKKEFLDLTHVGAGNIESHTGVFIDLKTAREEGLISGKFVFNESMVLYSKIRPYLMKVARPDFNGLCSADMYPLVPFPKEITRDYLFHLLLSKGFTDYAIQGSARAGMPKVNREHLFEFKLWLPDLQKQKQLAANLDEIHAETQRLERLYQQKLAALAALKKSLLHRAFSGELTSEWRESKIIPFPLVIAGIKATDLHAGLLAKAYQMHEARGNQSDFGHVKAEKIAHMIEAHVGIDLERAPVKDAAGPNDFPHLIKVEHRARKADFFDFRRVENAAYRVTKRPQFDALIKRAHDALGAKAAKVDRLLALMLPMDTRQSEIVATVFAAWNNLLLEGAEVSDEEIVVEARENWHRDKLRIPRDKFFTAINWMREKELVPQGRGKKVVPRIS